MAQQTGPGRVESLHVHGDKPGELLRAVTELSLVAGEGIAEDKRYFRRKNRYGGASRRHVSVIEREVIEAHAANLMTPNFAPGVVRSNVETSGIDLQQYVGWEVALGAAVVLFYEPRTPCSKMDKICSGLRLLMGDARQGMMAEVVRSGVVRVGDAVQPLVLREKKGRGISAV